MSKYAAVEAVLQGRLNRLLGRLGTIEGHLRSAPDRDSQERASELENDEVLEGLDQMSLDEVRQIREALARIDRGDYGICAACGRPIGPERLNALPTTVTCVGCARSS